GVDRADERAVAAADEIIDEALTPHDADVLNRIGLALDGGRIGDEDDAVAVVEVCGEVIAGAFVDVTFALLLVGHDGSPSCHPGAQFEEVMQTVIACHAVILRVLAKDPGDTDVPARSFASTLRMTNSFSASPRPRRARALHRGRARSSARLGLRVRCRPFP